MMRKSFNLYFLAIVGMLVVSVSSFGEEGKEKDKGGHQTPYTRPLGYPKLTGTIVEKAISVDTKDRFLRVKTTDGGTRDYRIIDSCKEAHESCMDIIKGCSVGGQCTIAGKVEDNPPSIAPAFAVAGPGANPRVAASEVRRTKTGKEYSRVSNKELEQAKVKNIEACVGKDGKEGAWAEPDYKNAKGETVKGKIFCGDVARDEKGNIRTMNHRDAEAYCKNVVGGELATGWPESQNGKNGFPNEDSDHVRLAKNMGATNADGDGYSYSAYVQGSTTQTVLPHLLTESGQTCWFWSSSVHPGHSNSAYGFDGRYGDVGPYYRYYANFKSVRCVVARR